jgi:hypothetical protein
VRSLPEWYDVDEPADLLRLQDDLRRAPASVAPRTRAVLEQLPAVRSRELSPSARAG